MLILSAIPIKAPWIEMILEGSKTWEIRSKITKKLGSVALIQSDTGTVVGIAKIVEVIELTKSLARQNSKKMGMTIADAVSYTGYYAWVLSDVIRFKKPVPYKHSSGAITWVTLDLATTQKVFSEAKRTAGR